MVHITLKHDNLTALGGEAFAILTGLAPLDLPGRSTATDPAGPAGVFDSPASRQVLIRRANQRATLDSGARWRESRSVRPWKTDHRPQGD